MLHLEKIQHDQMFQLHHVKLNLGSSENIVSTNAVPLRTTSKENRSVTERLDWTERKGPDYKLE